MSIEKEVISEYIKNELWRFPYEDRANLRESLGRLDPWINS